MPVADQEIIEPVKALVKALGSAFTVKDQDTVKQLISPDHVAVTPYAGRPLNTSEQLEKLAELDLEIVSVERETLTVLGPEAVLVHQEKILSGTYQGEPGPDRVYSTAIWTKLDGKWCERFYQETAVI